MKKLLKKILLLPSVRLWINPIYMIEDYNINGKTIQQDLQNFVYYEIWRINIIQFKKF